MATPAEIGKLRGNVFRILRSKECMELRFRVDNVSIQRHMYYYITQAIEDRNIKLDLGPNGYFHQHNLLRYVSTNPDAVDIVHEATHAAIDATHKDKSITKGTHELAAFLAEAMYGLMADDTRGMFAVPNMTRPIYALAKTAVAFNAKNPNKSFVCPPGDANFIKNIFSIGGMPVNRVDVQDGIGDGA